MACPCQHGPDNFKKHQNVVAVQYPCRIFYRVCKPIAHNEEFLTYYGDMYFYEMGGNPKTFHTNDPDHVEVVEGHGKSDYVRKTDAEEADKTITNEGARKVAPTEMYNKLSKL